METLKIIAQLINAIAWLCFAAALLRLADKIELQRKADDETPDA